MGKVTLKGKVSPCQGTVRYSTG